jgi:hypothetical protein
MAVRLFESQPSFAVWGGLFTLDAKAGGFAFSEV